MDKQTDHSVEVKTFDLLDVLTITTTRLLTTKGMPWVFDLVEFLTGEAVYSHQLPRVFSELKPHLLAQFPVLESPEMQFAFGELIAMMKTTSNESNRKHLIAGWLSKLTSGGYGFACDERLHVRPIPKSALTSMNPLEELAGMMGGSEKIIVIGVK